MSWTLTNADCIAAMRETPDKAYDLAIVDPPYGIGAGAAQQGMWNASRMAKKNWDASTPPQIYFDELTRVSKEQIIWGGNYFNLRPSRGYVVWDKGNGFTGRDFAECEMAWLSMDCNARIFRYDPLASGAYRNRFHPTQKPVALYKWLLKNYAKPNDRILDTHGGSCSSVIAAIDMGFSIDAYELDPDYYAQALKRIQTHELQPRLIPTTQEPQPMQAVLL